jgi:endonuclease YncB( thermonuclease family)
LRSLFASQGKRIVSDAEMEGMLGLQGIAGAQRTGLRDAIQEMAVKSGYIPESYLDDMVERAVLDEIENTLYAFDASSRMGAQSRIAFPFGKPWADMAGFWGREMVRKPVMRGWINKSNAMWLRSANEQGLLSFPLVPNRSAALLSRLAHTDFTIDKGILPGDEGGVLPGSEQSDFSPLFFLPTEGNNPFSYMLPGLGIVPIALLDFVMGELYDPVKEPVEYQQLQDDIGQFIPSVHFQQGGFISRMLGGGSLAKVGGMTVDLTGMLGNESFFNLTSWMGDISREIDRTREISALLADPKELEMLLEAKSVESAEVLLQAIAVTADQRASQAHLAESSVRYMVPVGNRFDSSLGEIQDVWIDAAQFENLSYLLPGDPERMTDQQLRQTANDIRDAFFKLDPWERDALVVQQPSLAVNMVGSWEWTANAINENLAGTDYAYRTGGSPSELALHESLVKRGYVRPVQPIERARRILGVIDAAKKSAAKELYTTQVNEVNTLLWEAVPEQEKAKLAWVLDTQFAKDWGLTAVEEVWSNWSRIEEDLELYVAEDAGVEPVRGVSTRKDDLTAFDNLRKAVGIPDKWKAWGTDFPSLNEEDVSSRFNEWEVISVDEKSAALAESLGIDIAAGMTGQELYAEVQQQIVQRTSPIFDVVRPAYDRYIADRSVTSGRNMLYEAAQSDLVAPEFQEKIHQFLFKNDLVGQRAKDSRVTRNEQDQMREDFLYIMHGSKDQKTDWNGIWKEQYQRRYGPLDWVSPEPASPFDANGDVDGDVIIPSVRHVVDGDTILIQNYPGSPTLNSVRILGIRAEEVNGPNADKALEQENALKDAIVQAANNGDSIYLVRDSRFGDTDRYGRMLAWLWIGKTPFYNVEDLSPVYDPGESN